MTNLHCGDCLEIMRDMPSASVDMVFCSPPYEAARTYGIGFNLRGQAWVDWAVERYVECLRVSKGLVAWVVEGQTRQFAWTATPALLMADLHRRGVKLRKPPAFHRVGIPGSGGPDWLRNDYEFIVCASQGKLPWSDNTAMGHPPKFAPGGDPSHRTQNGERVGRAKGPNGVRNYSNVSGEVTRRSRWYEPPALANPGNIVEINNDLRSLNFIDTLTQYENITQSNTSEILRDLRQAVDSGQLQRWWSGIFARVYQEKILQQSVQRHITETSQRPEIGRVASPGSQDRPSKTDSYHLRDLRNNDAAGGTSSRWGCDEQSDRELGCIVHDMPPGGTQDHQLLGAGLREAVLGDLVLFHALPEIQKIWRSLHEAVQSAPPAAESSNLIRCKVGGGHMGSALAILNEAPFPEALAEFFVKSFCPPGGTVLDPFCGSGTTLAASIKNGRNAIGIDIRQSQIDLTTRRLNEYQPLLAQ